MALGYSYVLAEAARDFTLRLPPDEQRRLGFTLRLLANTPFRTGDYLTEDQAGRALQNLLIEDWVFTYWPDHALKELRITEIAQV